MDRYIRFVLKRPMAVLIGFAVITLLFSAGMFDLKFDTSVATFLPQSDAEYKYYNRVKEVYGDCDTFVILSISADNLWRYDTFSHINDLLIDMEEFQHYRPDVEKHRMASLDALLSVSEITGTQLINRFGDDPAFKRLISRKLEKIGWESGALNRREKHRLKKAVAAANEIKSREMIDEIISPFTTKDIIGQDDTLETIDLIETDEHGNRILPKTKAEFDGFIHKLKRNPVFEKGIFAVDDKGDITDLGIILRFKDIADSDPIAREVLDIVKSHRELRIIPQGQPIIYIWVNNYMQQDLARLVPLVMLVAMIIFFLNFRTLRGVVLPTVTLAMATVWILGLMGLLGVKITTVGISIPILMIAVGSSYAIHILNQYYADFALIAQEGKEDGLRHSMAHISTTVLLAGLTTFVAFLTLGTHRLSAIREWGIFSALGVVFAVFISATIIPAGLELLPHRRTVSFGKRKVSAFPMMDRLIRCLSALSVTHYRMVMAIVLVLIGFSVAGMFKMKTETELLHYFKKDNTIRTSARVISEKFGGHWGFSILLDSGKTDGVRSAKFLGVIEDIRNWLQADKNRDLCIDRTDAFSDFIKTMHMAMNNDDPAYFKVPANDADILDYLEIYSDDDDNSDGRIDRFEPYVDPDFRTCNILARLGDKNGELLGSTGLDQIFRRISGHLSRTLPPGYSFKITGHPIMMNKSVDYIVGGQLQSLFMTLVVIGIVVLFLLRDFRSALLSLIPMSIAVIVNFGIMGWTGIRLDIATSIIAAITIGIGVDDTIHFLNTFRHFRQAGEDVDSAIRHTLHVAGKAIIFTSLALIFGFSVLELSTFKPLILFGLLMAVTMVATTIGALLVLPAAIKFTKVRLVHAETGAKHPRISADPVRFKPWQLKTKKSRIGVGPVIR